MTAKQKIGSLTIPWIPTVRPENVDSCYPYEKQVPTIDRLPPGWTFAEGRRAVEQALLHEQCVAIPLRDGVQVSLETVVRFADPIEILKQASDSMRCLQT